MCLVGLNVPGYPDNEAMDAEIHLQQGFQVSLRLLGEIGRRVSHRGIRIVSVSLDGLVQVKRSYPTHPCPPWGSS